MSCLKKKQKAKSTIGLSNTVGKFNVVLYKCNLVVNTIYFIVTLASLHPDVSLLFIAFVELYDSYTKSRDKNKLKIVLIKRYRTLAVIRSADSHIFDYRKIGSFSCHETCSAFSCKLVCVLNL